MKKLYVLVWRDYASRPIEDVVVFTNKADVADFLDLQKGWELKIMEPGQQWEG